MAERQSFRLDPDVDLVDIKEATEITGYSRRAIQNFVEENRIRSWRIGNQHVLYRPHVEALIGYNAGRGRPREREPKKVASR